MQFRVSSTLENPRFKPFLVSGDTYNKAATLAARIILWGPAMANKHRMVVLRVTGENAKSGWFQAYLPVGPALNSTGPAFHLFPL